MLCFSELDPDTLNRKTILGLHEHLRVLPFKPDLPRVGGQESEPSQNGRIFFPAATISKYSTAENWFETSFLFELACQ